MRRSTVLPPAVLRSRAIPRLLRFIIRNDAASSPIFGGTLWRVSSPRGVFSILITSAPISASMSVHVGPAMTWVRSITFNPASGPIDRLLHTYEDHTRQGPAVCRAAYASFLVL